MLHQRGKAIAFPLLVDEETLASLKKHCSSQKLSMISEKGFEPNLQSNVQKILNTLQDKRKSNIIIPRSKFSVAPNMAKI